MNGPTQRRFADVVGDHLTNTVPEPSTNAKKLLQKEIKAGEDASIQQKKILQKIEKADRSYRVLKSKLGRKLYPALKGRYDLQESYSNLCQLRFTYWKQQGSYGKPPHVPKQRNIIERRYSNSKTTYAFRQDLQVNNASTNTLDTELPSKLPNAFPIIWDSGAIVCITFDRNDFLNFKSNSSLTH